MTALNLNGYINVLYEKGTSEKYFHNTAVIHSILLSKWHFQKRGKGIRTEVTDCIKKKKKSKSSLTSVSESVLVKIPTKIRISAMLCALCARVCRCMVVYTVAKNSHGKKKKSKKVKPCLIVSLIMVPLNSLFIHHKTAKCGHYQKKKKKKKSKWNCC